MTGIYDQHAAAFRNVSAFIIAKDGERVATVAIKFPKDGAGRLYAYVHWIGVPMVRGSANGYGYDKRSAAVASAIPSMQMLHGVPGRMFTEAECANQQAFIDAARANTGQDWTRALEAEGFTVWQAV